jgi:hypothetical protein
MKKNAAFALGAFALGWITAAMNEKTAATPKISSTAAQAAGGARDRKARPADLARTCAFLIECSIRSKPAGTCSVGGCDVTKVETKKIEAQIAQ